MSPSDQRILGQRIRDIFLFPDIADHLGLSITSLLEQERELCRMIRAIEQPKIDTNKMALKVLPGDVVDDDCSIRLGKVGPGEIVGCHVTPSYELA